MDGSDAFDVRELALRNERLRDQQDAISSVLRAVVRSGELQPVLDEVATAAMRLCASEYAMLYVAEGELRPAGFEPAHSRAGLLAPVSHRCMHAGSCEQLRVIDFGVIEQDMAIRVDEGCPEAQVSLVSRVFWDDRSLIP